MKEPNDHLDIDLVFLDKKEQLKFMSKHDSRTGQSSVVPA